jgi:hypothetical protein
MILAQDVSLQRVLATEEHSGHYAGGSLRALEEKDKPGRARHSLSVLRP